MCTGDSKHSSSGVDYADNALRSGRWTPVVTFRAHILQICPQNHGLHTTTRLSTSRTHSHNLYRPETHAYATNEEVYIVGNVQKCPSCSLQLSRKTSSRTRRAAPTKRKTGCTDSWMTNGSYILQ
ncbi:hypothetical protein SCLCIDRAFT_479656 [Scleroderma citrinum Foug A]|uniref:Uncharacterized protein n=1 Tax=Scleroderma citrinum Foug A TaxID=1036808 RepID=A0A0C2ZJN3_9AGAM|nr:hypothetical protein SCLCIDRAFT_479656 [Scleroderma citrinum Foug A]